MAERLPSEGDSTPDGTPDLATDDSFAMVVSASTPDRPGVVPSALSPTVVLDVLTLCGACGGPAFFCGGDGVCPGGPEGLPDMVWMTKVRAVCVGTVLTQGSAAQFGGVLLRAALALRGGPPPRHGSELLWCRHRHRPLAPEAVALATEYLIEREVAPVSELSAFLRAHGAPWLTDMARDAMRAALLAPLARRGPDRLLAVLCGVCGDRARGWEVLRDASEYDDAVRCPGCRSLHGHPLPRVPVGLPHPVSRCVGGAWGAPDKCAAHDGHPLDDEGLCPTGRAIYEQTWEAAQPIAAGTRDPSEVGVLRAMRRAQQWRAGRDFVRTVGTALATVDVVRRPTGVAGIVAAVEHPGHGRGGCRGDGGWGWQEAGRGWQGHRARVAGGTAPETATWCATSRRGGGFT